MALLYLEVFVTYGITISRDGKAVRNALEWQLIERVGEMYAGGMTHQQISTYLNDRGISKRGKRWSAKSIERLFTSKWFLYA